MYACLTAKTSKKKKEKVTTQFNSIYFGRLINEFIICVFLVRVYIISMKKENIHRIVAIFHKIIIVSVKPDLGKRK